MNLGVVSYDFDPPIGGLGVIAREYARMLSAIDPTIRVTVVSPSTGGDEHVSPLASSRWMRSGGCPLFSQLFNVHLSRLVSCHALDCILLHAGSGGVFLLRRPRCPVVVVSHHTYVQEARVLFRHLPLKRAWKLLMSLFERRTYRLADRIVCVSGDTADALVRHYGVPRSKITVIENFVDDLFFDRAPRTPTKGSIVYVGRVEERKGVVTLLRAFAEVAKRDELVSLTLIGANLIGDALGHELQSLGITDRVRVTGYLPQSDRLAIMQSAALMVVPSLLEGFGLVAAEAMAMGLPVLVSDADGLRSLVTNGKTGSVFTAGSVSSLRDELLEILADPDRRERLATAGREDALKRFRLADRARDLRNLVEATVRQTNK